MTARLLAGALSCLVLPQVATAANYTICVEWQIETSDSCDDASCGIPFGANAGGHEDYFASCNDPGCEVPARGVRVKMARAGWTQSFDADDDGCFSFVDNGASYTMTVYGFASNSNGSFVRIHDAPFDFSDYPGKTHSLLLTGVTPTHNGANTYAVGGFDRKWTTMAALAHGSFVWRGSLVDKEIHAGLDPANCSSASAHFHNCLGSTCSSNADITGGRHYLYVGTQQTPECSAPVATYKFTVGHELGHAIAALWYGGKPGAKNGGEPAFDDSLTTTPNSCGASKSYSMGSKEFNNIGFREGFAHFISARIWNAKAAEAALMWYEDDIYDMERWGFGKGTAPGGRLQNECTGSWASAGTNEDWMRFFWDWYTNTDAKCAGQPDGNDMLDLYAQVRLDGGLTAKNYFSQLRSAASELDLPTCLTSTRLDDHAAANGLNQYSLR